MPVITFLPSGRRVECSPGETLFEAGRRAGEPIDTACVGQGTCGRCRVKIIAGADQLPPYGDVETKHLGNVHFITKMRLSCQCPVQGDVTVEIPPPRPGPKARAQPGPPAATSKPRLIPSTDAKPLVDRRDGPGAAPGRRRRRKPTR